jgi:hypothetical protein
MRVLVGLLTTLFLAAPGSARGQGRTYLGNLTKEAETPEVREAMVDSNVSFLDSAVPLNRIRTRYDLNYTNRRPTRSEFLYMKEALPLNETRIDQQEISTYVEFAISPWLSFFAETPFRVVNPEINGNKSGNGDLSFGGKLAIFDTKTFLLSAQLRASAPMHTSPILGNTWAIEPALLANWQIIEAVTLEGEVRYWTAFNDHAYRGDVLRYGLGLTYGHRVSNMVTLMPVLEVIGWTTLGGKMDVPIPGGLFQTENASGETIVNGALGVRTALGDVADFYLGYSRAITDAAWYRDVFRLEIRFMY